MNRAIVIVQYTLIEKSMRVSSYVHCEFVQLCCSVFTIETCIEDKWLLVTMQLDPPWNTL